MTNDLVNSSISALPEFAINTSIKNINTRQMIKRELLGKFFKKIAQIIDSKYGPVTVISGNFILNVRIAR